jgi:hypothetical protein
VVEAKEQVVSGTLHHLTLEYMDDATCVCCLEPILMCMSHMIKMIELFLYDLSHY